METCQTCGGMGTVSRGGWWGDKGERRGEAHLLEHSSRCSQTPQGLHTPPAGPGRAAAGLGLGQGWVMDAAWPRVYTHQALAGGLSVCSGCEVTLLWMCHGGAYTSGLLPVSLGHLGQSSGLARPR